MCSHWVATWQEKNNSMVVRSVGSLRLSQNQDFSSHFCRILIPCLDCMQTRIWPRCAVLCHGPSHRILSHDKQCTHPIVLCPQVNGFAARFEKAGHELSYAAVTNFFSIVTRAHSFATGGNNDHEYWGPPRQLADSIVLVSSIPVTSRHQRFLL